jgi:Flp pilus assembly protein TadG
VNLWRDTRATAALEAAIVLPGLIFLAGAFFALAGAFMQASACQYSAQAAAYQAVHFGQQAAEQTATVNAGLFMFSTPTITVAQSGDQWVVTCTSTMPSLVPGFGPFSTTATASD